MNSALLTIVRHGETAANTGGVWHGSTDTPLSERGQRQARAVGAHLSRVPEVFRHIYSSPLQRARHTADAIAHGLDLEVQEDSGLTEYDLGRWEGKTYQDLYTNYKLWEHMKNDPHYAPHGGESPVQVVTRYVDALRAIAARHPGEGVIVAGHGGALSMALAELVEGAYTAWGRVMDNCAVSELRLEPQPMLERFNFTDHLDGI